MRAELLIDDAIRGVMTRVIRGNDTFYTLYIYSTLLTWVRVRRCGPDQREAAACRVARSRKVGCIRQKTVWASL